MKTVYRILLWGSTGWLACTLQPTAVRAQQAAPSETVYDKTPEEQDTQGFTITLLLDQSPEEVFTAINNARGWWSEEIEGDTHALNSAFTYHFQDVHRSKMKVTAFVPNKKVEWLVLNNYFKFTKDKTEWTGTRIRFEISRLGDKTQLRFSHLGLTPEYECFSVCSNGWNQYIRQSLVNLITTGKGQPNAAGKPQTADEKKLGGR